MVMFNDLSSAAPTSGKFPLGNLVATPGAIRALVAAGQDGTELLGRHLRGDWGDVCAEDKKANDGAIAGGDRIFSAYALGTGVKLWIITEADRSSTCILLPDEY